MHILGDDEDTISKEVFRVNVYREQTRPNSSAQCVAVRVDEVEMDVEFDPSDIYDTYYGELNEYRVFVPATMLFDTDRQGQANLNGNFYNQRVRSHLNQRYRRQAGHHLFITCRFPFLRYLRTWWLARPPPAANVAIDLRRYIIEPLAQPIACMYPCLRVGATQLVMGLVFCNPTQLRMRSYFLIKWFSGIQSRIDLSERTLHHTNRSTVQLQWRYVSTKRLCLRVLRVQRCAPSAQ